MRSDTVDLSALGFMPRSMQSTLEKGIEQRNEGAIPTAQVHELLYADLVRDPVGSLVDCYAHHRLPYDQRIGAAARAYLDAKPRGKHGAHEYTVEQFGLEPISLGKMFERYRAHYGVPEEVDR